MAPRETENNAYAKFGVTNEEHYGMFSALEARDSVMYSYMQMLISKIPAIVCAHLALVICSLRVKIDV